MAQRLNTREYRTAVLCLLHGYSRPEAAALMGLDREAMEELMHRVTKKLLSIVARDLCPSQQKPVRAYALGRINATDPCHAETLRHLANCPDCARFCQAVANLAGRPERSTHHA